MAAASATTWGICRWWFGRKLTAAAARIDKLDKARHFLGQQVMQARRQVEKLQRDAAALQRRPEAGSSPITPPTRARQLEAVLRTVDDIPALPSMPVDGFAETQAMPRGS